MAVPSGHPDSLVGQVQRPYHKASQADSAGSIPVTRSTVTRSARACERSQVTGSGAVLSLCGTCPSNRESA
jgi:hypothetical protein